MEKLIHEIYTFKDRIEDVENDYLLKVQQKLYEYEQLEEQGLLVGLPCKIGDTVWCTTSDQYDYILEPIKCIVNEISANIDNPTEIIFRIDSVDSTDGWTATFPDVSIPNHMNIRRIKDFNKTVFPTREEAENHLTNI